MQRSFHHYTMRTTMNLELLSPIAQEYPDRLSGHLVSSAGVAQFSPTGQLLAAGRDDGSVELWDLHTFEVLRRLVGHVKAVVSVSWSRNGRYLLTASRDWTCAVWDLNSESLTGCKRDTLWFDAPVTWAVFHPHTSHIILVTLSSNECILIDLRQPRKLGRWKLHDPEEPYHKSTGITTARFTPDGKYVWAGTAAGHCMIFDAPSRQLIVSAQLDSKAAIRRLEVDPSGTYFAAISSDRFVRVYRVILPDFSQPPPMTPSPPPPPPLGEEPQPNGHEVNGQGQEGEDGEGQEDEEEEGITLIHSYSDQIGRCSWSGLCWSPDGEYVIAGSGEKGSHKLFIWFRAMNGLARMLDDRGAAVEDVSWHPYLPLIASVSHGRINLWSALRKENWSAFAPGFEETEENIEYEERENEFDIEDEDDIRRRKRAVEEIDVDIGGTPPPPPEHLPSRAAISGSTEGEDVQMEEDLGDVSDDDPEFFPPVLLDEE